MTGHKFTIAKMNRERSSGIVHLPIDWVKIQARKDKRREGKEAPPIRIHADKEVLFCLKKNSRCLRAVCAVGDHPQVQSSGNAERDRKAHEVT
jgi:hypothetical protein